MHRRKTSALNQIGHITAEVGVDDLRAGNAHDLAHLLSRQIADLKNAGLHHLSQEHGFVLDLGLHRGGDGDLKHTFRYRVGIHTQLNIHRGGLLLQQDGGGIGLLQRGFLQVDALNLKNGVELLCHGDTFWSIKTRTQAAKMGP